MALFLQLLCTTSEGGEEVRLVNVNDISNIKPNPKRRDTHCRSLVSLISNDAFPVWATETVEEIQIALRALGCHVAPHAIAPRERT